MLKREGLRTIDEMMQVVQVVPEAIAAWNVTGEGDFVVRMIARDMESYDDLARRQFAADDRVRSFQKLVLIRQEKRLVRSRCPDCSGTSDA